MKSLSPALAAHLEGECLTLAHCWKLTRRDGEIMGFTNHDRNLVIDMVTYEAATGFTPTAIEAQSSLAVDNLDVEGMLSTGSIAEADILAGRYDFAEIKAFVVNYADLSQGSIKLRRGWLGEVRISGKQFIAEVRGLTQKLAQHIGELYSPMCRARLGDARCGVDLEALTVTGEITAAVSQSQFIDSSRGEADGYFNYGRITFTSGLNEDLSGEVKEFRDGVMTLALPMPYAVAAGDNYSLEPGCDKTLSTCIARYGNALNFRGEPHVPGIDKMLETAGTRSEW